MGRKFLLVIDGSSLLSTQYYGNLPKEIRFESDEEIRKLHYKKIMQTSTGIYTNAIYGFLRTLFRIIKEQKPSHVVICWDVSRDTFRQRKYPYYKANRKETSEPLKQQFITCKKVLNAINICQLEHEKYEADDFCGTVAKMFEDDLPVRILTKDKDLLQLISEKTNLWMIQNKKEDVYELFMKHGMNPDNYQFPYKTFRMNLSVAENEYGYDPRLCHQVKAIMGDSSDNIKGVPGVGSETAIKLINEYKTIDALYSAIEGLDNKGKKEISKRWKEDLGISRSPINSLLREDGIELVGKKAAQESLELATIVSDIDFEEIEWYRPLTLNDLEINILQNKINEQLEKLEIKTLNL